MSRGDAPPPGWTTCKLDDLANDVSYGYTASSTEQPVGPRMLRITDIQDSKVNWLTVPYCKISREDTAKHLLQDGDLVFARTGATVGKSFRITGEIPEAVFASYLIRVRCTVEGVSRYLAHFFRSKEYWDQVTEFSAGIGQPNVNGTKLRNLTVPLAPLREQIRISDRLDSLIKRLDSCREHLERVPKILKRFREAVLEAAVSGRLTEEWRNNHASKGPAPNYKIITEYEGATLPALPLAWHWALFSDVVRIESNLVDPTKHPTAPHIAPNHIESWTGRLLPHGTIQSDGVTSGKHVFHSGQVLYSKIRPYLAKAVVVDFDGLCSADMYPLSGVAVSSRYLQQWLLTRMFTNFATSHEGRTVLPKINQIALNSIPVPVPPADEQREIVRRVDEMFVLADSLRRRYTSALVAIEALVPSVLSKAFRGELVPQNLHDEPATVLLERIRKGREEATSEKNGNGAAALEESEPVRAKKSERTGLAGKPTRSRGVVRAAKVSSRRAGARNRAR